MDDLETASGPREGLRRVAIDPLSRVEGHGKVTLLLDEQDRVQQVRLHIVEFRGFERFIEGRPYWEVPVLVQRLCGICPVSHHLAASKAMDRVVGVDRPPPTADKIRRLMHHGQILQSHALHFFHLSSPDLLLGFDSEPGQRHLVGVLERYPEVARQGILLRKFGQEVIRLTAGKRVHGTASVPGGVNRSLTGAERLQLQQGLDEVLGWCQQAVQLITELSEAEAERYARFAHVESGMMGLVDPSGALDLYEGGLRVHDAQGRPLVDHFDVQHYDRLISEEVKPWTYMKFPYLTALGPERGWYKVGPLARLQLADRLGTPLAEQARQVWRHRQGGALQHGSLSYHRARMIEMLHAAEVIEQLLDDPDLEGSERLAQGGRRREGVGVIEAPRGTLIHHYRVDDNDLVSMANLIVSTTHNNQAMNHAVRDVARQMFDGRRLTEGLLNHIEVAIRAFDPCLSCATHALGQMALEVVLLDAHGQERERRVRSA